MKGFLSPDHTTPAGNSIWPNYSKRRLFLFITLGFFTLCFIINFLIQQIKGSFKTDRAMPVVVSTVINKDISVYLSSLGNVIPTRTITIKTQVNGLLMKVLYKEGQFVKKGQKIIEIDKRPLLAQFTQYQGQLKRDQALLANAIIDLERYTKLWKQKSISQQTFNTQQSLVKQYEGTIEVDQGLIDSTLIKLNYCDIISPVNGRVGLRLVDPGNVVQTTDPTGLLVITTTDPITVIFSIPEDSVPRVLPQVLAKKSIPVKLYDRQQHTLLATGNLLTIDNQIDPTTGMVKLRALFDNKNNRLFSNQFVNTKLLVQKLSDALIVPTAAIQHGRDGDFVFLLQKDSTVTSVSVITGVSQGENTVVLKGLSKGQQVVVEGADQLSNGVKVALPILPSPLN